MRRRVIGNATLYQGDFLAWLPSVLQIGAIVSDPPYPNNAGHFLDGVEAARRLIAAPPCDHVIAFWDELEEPVSVLPLVAKHVWFRTNTNRPDNYEAIYEWRKDGQRKASKVFPFAVIAVGLTGCTEATGHPTQKHTELMKRLVSMTEGVVLDPFMGSGTTGVACMNLGRQFIGVELREDYFDIACQRIENAQRQERLFA